MRIPNGNPKATRLANSYETSARRSSGPNSWIAKHSIVDENSNRPASDINSVVRRMACEDERLNMRIVHIARGFEDADRWDRHQNRSMTPDERRACARALRERVYGTDCPDIREAREVHTGVHPT